MRRSAKTQTVFNGEVILRLSKLLIGTASLALIAGSPALAVAGDANWYVSVFGGGVSDAFAYADDDPYDSNTDDVEVDTEFGWTLGLAAGFRMSDTMRGEVELSTTRTGLEHASEGSLGTDVGGNLTTGYLLGNMWFDLDTGAGFTPYLGGGLGAGYLHIEANPTPSSTLLDADGIGLGYQVGAGVNFDVSENVGVDLGYRFKGISGADITGEGTIGVPAHVGSHVIQAGLTFGF
ncbi:outer membrane beta-barrel protein [Oricola sp.]|uniref:outer membrane protein n=1 Tax=Oricola sp. TaxID=1979950 RepID=UPI0025F719DF|nr:outer membrane beta-barrel protein [Oricola sp.]MCI5073446.1 acyloxyacyl hydrolase [Oricola sp.]